MSTEAMQEQVVLEGSGCAVGANKTCKAALRTSSKALIANYTNVTTVSDEEVVELVTEIATVVDETRDLENVMIELRHVISLRAAIDWTTIGHVGTDVFGKHLGDKQCCLPTSTSLRNRDRSQDGKDLRQRSEL